MYTVHQLVTTLKLDRFSPLKNLNEKLKFSDSNIMLLLAIVIGMGGGFAAVSFRFLLHSAHHYCFSVIYPWLCGYSPYLLPIIPVAGALMLIPFSMKYPGEVYGYGLPKFLIMVHLKGGLVRTRTIFLKIVTTAITIGTGGAAGVEGPIAQVGGAIGSSVGRFFQMSTQRLKVLIACGSAAGIAAQFNAPLAGVLFALEIVMVGEFQLQAFGVIVISSGLATAVSRAFYTDNPTFGTLQYTLTSYHELFFYSILGIVIGVLAFLFIKIFFGIGDFFEKVNIPKHLKRVVGALIVGLMGLLNFEVLSDGYEFIKEVLNSSPTVAFSSIAMLIFMKMIATSITLGSGNVGGVFAPALFIGAMIGGAFGWILSYLFPDMGIQPGSYALVGMGAFLAAATHAPMTAIFLLFELTSNYQVIIPIMFASVIGVMISQVFSEDSLDSMELSRQGIHLHSGKEVNLLNAISVEEVMSYDFEWIYERMTFASFMKMLPQSRTQYYPVLNEQKELTGIISFREFREILVEEGLEDLIVMKELATTDFTVLHIDDNLTAAMENFGSHDREMIPVVDRQDKKNILGMLRRTDVIVAYNNAVLMKEVADEKK